MTKLAVIADIHGNSCALKAVLDDLDERGGADQLIVLGDLAVFGPDPNGVLNLLRDREQVVHICGNTDRYLVEEQYPTGSGAESWEAQVLASFPWTAKQLGSRGLAFLANLSANELLHLSPEHTVLAVHGSPRGDEENMRPDTPEAELAEMMTDGPAYNLLLCAHTHLPMDRVVNGRRVINVGSVGLPFDGDQRASYVLIELEAGGGYKVEFRRVTYDVNLVVNQLVVKSHPTTEVSTFNLQAARPLGHKLIYTEKMRKGLLKPEKPEPNSQVACLKPCAA